jgi:putative DNA primase/helicase
MGSTGEARLDFKEVAAAALEMAPTLLPEWVGGQRRGREWVAERKSNGGLGDSVSINLDTGRWSAFASGDTGGDMVSYYAWIHHIDQLPALKEVAAACGVTDTTAKILPRSAPAPTPNVPDWIPPDAPMIPAHFKHGAPVATYRYGNAFVIARYESDEGKSFSPFTWRGGKWVAKAWPDPKPLYGAELLIKHPNSPVLIVEGEKCADIGRATLKAYVVITWASGAGAVKKSDWSPLEGR